MCLATGMISRGRIQQLLALPTSPTHLFLAEIYSSLQGEGLLTGTPSIFVRASGCNLRCWFCDTPYTSWEPEGKDWSIEEIVEEVERLTAALQIAIPVSERERGRESLAAERLPLPSSDIPPKIPDPLKPIRHIV